MDGSSNAQNLTTAEVLSMTQPNADRRIAYGDAPQQFGDLRVPHPDRGWKGGHKSPIAIVIHGGCWSSHGRPQRSSTFRPNRL